MNESDLIEITKTLDQLVVKCISGEMPFDAFLKEYGYPIGEYALDGHESNEEEKILLRKFANSLKLHMEIAECVLNKLCTTEQAQEQAYIQAGRIGPNQGFLLLKEVAARNGL